MQIHALLISHIPPLSPVYHFMVPSLIRRATDWVYSTDYQCLLLIPSQQISYTLETDFLYLRNKYLPYKKKSRLRTHACI